MTTKFLSDHARSGLAKALEHATAFSAKHGWAVGVAEMACGAALIALGVQNGAIEMGTELVATALDDTIDPGLAGAGLGSGLGVLPGLILKNIGVAALGTAVSVPAVALMGGGALLLGLAGYGLGPLVKEYLFPVPQLADFIGPGSLLLVGVALMVDGARRIVKNPLVRATAARYAGGALRLAKIATGRVLVSSGELVAYLDELAGRIQFRGRGGSHTVGVGRRVLVGVLAPAVVCGLVAFFLLRSAVISLLASIIAGVLGGLASYRWWAKPLGMGTPLVLPRMEALRLTYDPPGT